MHDATHDDLSTVTAEESTDSDIHVLDLETFLDITKACEAGIDPIKSGTVKLLLEAVSCRNQTNHTKTWPIKNKLWTEIEVQCDQSKYRILSCLFLELLCMM